MKKFKRVAIILFSSSYLALPANAKGLFQYVGLKANFPTVDFDIAQLEDESTAEIESEDTLGYLSRDPEIIGIFAKAGHFSFELTHNISDDANTADYKNFDISWYHKRLAVRVMLSEIEDFYLNQGEGNIDLESLGEDDIDQEGFFFQNAALDLSAGVLSWGLHMANTLDLAEYPKKTGGGLLVILSGDWTWIDGPKPLIPVSLQNEFGSDGTILSADMMSANIELGLVQGLALGPLFMGISLSAGPGTAFIDYELENSKLSREIESFKTSLGLNLGISTKSFFFGLEAHQRIQEYLLESIAIATVRSNFGACIGMRF